MAGWDNYKRLKAAGRVSLGVQETTVGTPYVKTMKHSFDPETGTQREDTVEVTDINQATARELELQKELASVTAWKTDAQAVIDAWYAEQVPE